jgi:hypothetical protein
MNIGCYKAIFQITENRDLSPKYDEMKRQGLFIRSSLDFYKTEWMGSTNQTYSPYVDILSNPDVFVTVLQNPDTNARFYIVRNNDSTSTYVSTASLFVP